jgi:hypothetical protein
MLVLRAAVGRAKRHFRGAIAQIIFAVAAIAALFATAAAALAQIPARAPPRLRALALHLRKPGAR